MRRVRYSKIATQPDASREKIHFKIGLPGFIVDGRPRKWFSMVACMWRLRTTFQCPDRYYFRPFHLAQRWFFSAKGHIIQDIIIWSLERSVRCTEEEQQEVQRTSGCSESNLTIFHACSLVQGKCLDSSSSSPNAFFLSSFTPRSTISSTASSTRRPFRILCISCSDAKLVYITIVTTVPSYSRALGHLLSLRGARHGQLVPE